MERVNSPSQEIQTDLFIMRVFLPMEHLHFIQRLVRVFLLFTPWSFQQAMCLKSKEARSLKITFRNGRGTLRKSLTAQPLLTTEELSHKSEPWDAEEKVIG